MEDDFDELLNTTVRITAGPTSRTVFGVETYSTSGGSTFNARYVEKRDEVRLGNGEVVAQSGVLWINSTAALSTKARVFINQVSRAFPVLSIERPPDETGGVHHVKLRLGW